MFEAIRRNLANILAPETKQKGEPLNLSSVFTPGIPIYTDLTTQKAVRQGYKISVYVYRSIRTIVQAASGIPWIVLDKNGEEIPDHEFTKAWANPNPEFSGQDMMEFIIAHLKLVGNAFIQPIMVNGRPREFWVCMPDLIQPVPSEVKGEWLKGYQITEVGGRQITVPPETFIHFMQFDPGNPYWGIGDLMAAARTVDTDNEAQDTQKVSMQNRGLPSGVFEHEAPLTQEQFEEQNRRIQEIYLDKTKRRAPWVLGAGAKWQQMSLTPVEMDFINSRIQNKRDIAAAFGVDSWFLGEKEFSSFNNIQEARKSLYEQTVIPLLDDIRATLNLKLAPIYGDVYITYDVSNVAAMREDYGKKVEQARNLWGMGVPFEQINEKLEMGFEEFPGWDRGYLPLTLLPAGSMPVEEGKAYKSLDTEEAKMAYWKGIDRRKLGWEAAVAKKMLSLYNAEGKEVAKVEGDKEQMIKLATDKIEGLRKDWEKTLTAVEVSIIEDFGNEIADELGATKERKWRFDPFKPSVRKWITKHTAESIKTILDTNKDDVKQIIRKGFDEDLSTPQIAKEIRQFYDDQSKYKAMRVARTEVASASSYGHIEAARQSGVVKTKTWLSSRDDRVRDSHISMDGETVGLEERFSNGCEAPGIGDDPGEVINCRCVLQFGVGR